MLLDRQTETHTDTFIHRISTRDEVISITSQGNMLLFCAYLTPVTYSVDPVIPVLIRLKQLTATLKCTMLVSGCNDGVMLIYLTLQLLYSRCISLQHNTATNVLQCSSGTNGKGCK